jgi:hypothetical protein
MLQESTTGCQGVGIVEGDDISNGGKHAVRLAKHVVLALIGACDHEVADGVVVPADMDQLIEEENQ